MKRIILVFIIAVGAVLNVAAQTPSTCDAAIALCGNGISAPNVTSGSGYGAVGCLGSTPRPAWYFIKIGNSGSLTVQISQSNNNGGGLDVDYALWGPFANPTSPCSGLPNGSPIACSYSTASVESFSINGNSGDYYILLVTNYSGGNGSVFLAQTGGTGSLDCNVTPPCVDPTSNIYFSTSAGSGYLDLVEGCMCGTIDVWLSFPYPGSTALMYSLSGTATAPLDYAPQTGYIGFSPGWNHGSTVLCPDADGLLEGTEDVTFTLYAPCSQNAIGSVTFNIIDEYVHGASATPASVCQGETTQLQATGEPVATFNWDPPGAVSSPTIANPTSVPLYGTTTFYVDIDNGGGCVYRDSVTVPVDSVVAMANYSPTVPCIGDTVWLTGSATGSGAPSYDYSWSPPNLVSDPTAQSTYVTPSAPTTYVLSVTSLNTGCSDTAMVTVNTVTQMPVSYSFDSIICPEASIVFNVPPVFPPGTIYNWSGSLGTGTPVTINNPGNYTLTATVPTGCQYIVDSIVVNDFVVVNPQALDDTTICAGNTATVASSDLTLSNYQWQPNLEITPSIVVTATGRYYFTANDTNSCIVRSDTAFVTVNPNPVITFNLIKPLCVGQGEGILSAGSQPNTTYVWSTPSVNDTIVTLTGGPVSVTATLNGCTSTDSYNITAAPVPTLELGNAKNSCCEDIVLNPTPDPTFTYSWSSGSTGPSLTVNGFTTVVGQVYTVTAANPFGCTVVDTDTVNIWCIHPNGYASPDTILAGANSVLSVTTEYDNGNFTYGWNPPTGLTNITGPTANASPPESTVYTVVVTDTIYGCMDEASIYLVVIYPGEIAMPSAFTPNGDGHNDQYYPVTYSNQLVVHEFRVYNRWGEVVHNNPLVGWDGRYQGLEQPVEVYTYYVYVEVPDPNNLGEMIPIKRQGSFTLLR